MSTPISFSGLASGIDSNAIVSQLMAIDRQSLSKYTDQKTKLSQQQTQMNNIRTATSNLKSAIQKLTDAKLGGSFDIFKRKSAVSSDTATIGATASASATAGSYTMTVVALATATKAQSLTQAGKVTTLTTAVTGINGGTVTEGNFSVFVDGTRYNISVSNTDTVQDILNRVTAVLPSPPAPTADVDSEGKINLGYAEGTNVSFGASGDTSNFAQVTKLTTGSTTTDNGVTTFKSTFGTNSTKSSATLTDNAANLTTAVTAGTFTVGTKTFTVDGTTTLDDLLGDINNAGEVIATYDRNTNKVNLTSRSTGNQAITLGSGSDTSNFLTAVGLVDSGNSLNSQTLGQNARFTIDGTTFQSKSNTGIDASTHGYTGLTLDLKKESVGNIALTVGQNTDDLKAAVSDVVNKFNSFLNLVKNQTGEGGLLRSDNTIKSFRDQLRYTMSGSVSGPSTYSYLRSIGIGTGAVSSNADAGTTPSFSFTESDFLAALNDKPEEVKALLVGDGTESNLGIMGTMLQKINGSLDTKFGLFTTRTNSTNSRIKAINDSITRQTQRLDSKEKRLRAQFTAMESAISSLRQQQSSLPTYQ